MKILVIALILFLSPKAAGVELTAPPVTGQAAQLMPEESMSLGEGFMNILSRAFASAHPDITEAVGICRKIFGVVLLTGILRAIPGAAEAPLDLVGCTSISVLYLGSANAMIALAVQTVHQLSSYGKLLFPVLTSAMAAQGGVGTSASLYMGTMVFNTLLTALAEKLLIPLIYVFLALIVAGGALEQPLLKKMAQFVKWLLTWCLKILLYIFTGYMGLTGVVSGATDAAALKAAKIAISGVVPVVGGILADASEAVLVSASMVRNAAGIYGIFAIASIVIVPFLRLGVHYLMLKTTGALCQILGSSRQSSLIEDLSGALGLLLALTGAMGLILLISVVCFLRGVG